MTICSDEVLGSPNDPAWAGQFRWFAIQSKPREEEVASHTLRSLDIEVLLPKARRRGARGPAVRPLFSGYLFGRLCLSKHFHAVRYSRGVVRVLGSRNQPVPVDDLAIAACRERMDSTGTIALDEPEFRRGDQIQIESGPFAGFHGVFERSLDDQARVVILLDALQKATLILDRRHVVPAGD